MPRTCTICTHEDKPVIDQALVDNMAYRTIADRYGLSHQALMRHKAEHLPSIMVKSEQAKEVTRADDLIAQLQAITARTERLYTIADGIIGKAVSGADWRTALMAVREASNANREARSNLELLGELLGELNRNPTVNIHLSAEWVRIQTVLYRALAPYPEAGASVVQALQEIERAD